MRKSSAQGNPSVESAIRDAIALIARIPGYEETGAILSALYGTGDLRFDPRLPDRATTDFRGVITVGPEPIQEGRVSLAETLVHEQFHRTQPAYTKTISFWSGVITRTPVWRQLELPAYRAAHDFLVALERYARHHQLPDLTGEAQKEQRAVTLSFQALYGAPLNPTTPI